MKEYNVTVKGKYTPEEKYLMYAETRREAIDKAVALYRQHHRLTQSLSGDCKPVKKKR
jgi:hypothetical protein